VRRRTRLNIALYALVIVCTVAVCLLAAIAMPSAYRDKGGTTTRSGWGNVLDAVDVALDRHHEGATDLIGTDVGPGRVEAVPAASEADQDKWAAILASATDMANAFLNVDYRTMDDTRDKVLALATGPFKKQYTKSFKSLSTFTQRAKSVQTGEVVWAGISSVDNDSATVFIATNGTVVNTTVDEPQARPYRLQLELALVDGKWLTRNLVFIEVQNPTPDTGSTGNGTTKGSGR
jgi:Mce-associated membrane protein